MQMNGDLWLNHNTRGSELIDQKNTYDKYDEKDFPKGRFFPN